MAKIPKSGIANAQTIQASHITNIIEALDGTGSYDVVATGSFTGSFTGDGSNITGVTAEWDGTHVGNAEITGSLILTGDVTASSYTGSFVGDGSGLDGVVATTLFALSEGSGVSEFTFDGTFTQTINISGSVGLTTDTITKWTGDAFADTSITDDGAVVDITSDTTITGSLTVGDELRATGLTQGGGTDTVAMYDTGSGQFFFTASSAIGGGGSDTNFANTSLTFDGNRAHDLNGFRVAFESASLNVFGISNTGVNVNAGQADRDFRVYTQGNTSTLFVEGSSDRVGVGKNTPNATLDVNGNAIISGSALISGSLGVTGSVSNLLKKVDLENLTNGSTFQYTGEVIEVRTLDGGVSLYDAVVLGGDNVWRQTTNNTEASSSGLLGVCIDVGSQFVLLEGMLTCDFGGQGSNVGLIIGGSIGVPGSRVYLSSGGQLTTEATTVSGEVLRIVGYFAHQNINNASDDYVLKFKPSAEWFVVA